MIDLHAHTTESDGTLSPAVLIREACSIGLEALAISDHDTMAGYRAAVAEAASAGLELIGAIEIGTRHPVPGRRRGLSVHMLGYFLRAEPPPAFHQWIEEIQASRRDRNGRLAARLQELGLDVRLEEVEALGRALTGRPHFARVLVEKGYAATVEEAFGVYLDETAKAYVPRREPSTREAIEKLRSSGAVPVLAHPFRLADGDREREFDLISSFRRDGLEGLEVWHSDHSAGDVERFLMLARRFDLAATGGSDFHGTTKPGVRLGTGRNGNLSIPPAVLEGLRERAWRI